MHLSTSVNNWKKVIIEIKSLLGQIGQENIIIDSSRFYHQLPETRTSCQKRPYISIYDEMFEMLEYISRIKENVQSYVITFRRSVWAFIQYTKLLASVLFF